MGAANSFAALTEGWFRGVGIREQREDRARQIERQKKLDAYADEQFGWARNDQKRTAERFDWDKDLHGARMGEVADADRMRDRAWSDAEAMRSDLAAATAAADAGIQPAAPAEPAGPALPPGVAPVAPPSQTAPALSAPEAPGPLRLTIKPDANTGSRLYGPPMPPQAPPPPPAAPAAPRGPQPDPYAGTILERTPDHQWLQPGGIGGDAREVGKILGRGLDRAGDAAVDGIGALGNAAVGTVTEPGARVVDGINAAGRYATGANVLPEPTHRPTAIGAAANMIGSALGIMGADGKKPDPEKVPAADPTKPATQAAAATAAATVAQTATGPQLQGATQGVPADKMHTPETRERVATDYLESFRENGLPILVRGMISRGDIEGAQQLVEWAEGARVQAGIKKWAMAGYAATIGDFDGFAKNLYSAYNDAGYFDDGFQILPDKSGFMRTEHGDITGAVITFKEQETGREFQQSFAGLEDMVNAGVNLLAPEAAFAHASDAAAKQTEALAGVATAARTEAETRRDKILDISAKLVEGSKDLSGQPTMTMDEAMEQAALSYDRAGGAGKSTGGAALYGYID